MKIEAAHGSALSNASQVLHDQMRGDASRLNGVGELDMTDGVSRVGTADASEASQIKEAGGFGAVFAGLVNNASDMDRTASAKVQALAAGKSDDLHGTMISQKEADISMKLVGTVRDKLMDAFHELWRINV